MAPLNQLTGRYFGDYEGAKSRANLAMSYHLLEAVKEVAGEFVIDYEKVVITKGILPVLEMDSAVLNNNEIQLTWTSNADFGLAKATDKLVAVLYSKTHSMFYHIEDKATRADGVLRAPIPADWVVNDTEAWVFWLAEEGSDCSTSVYLSLL